MPRVGPVLKALSALGVLLAVLSLAVSSTHVLSSSTVWRHPPPDAPLRGGAPARSDALSHADSRDAPSAAPPARPVSLVIHVVPTAHLDPGWRWSFEEYLGASTVPPGLLSSPTSVTAAIDGQGQGTRILESALLALFCVPGSARPSPPSPRYSLSDMAFLLQWLSVRGGMRPFGDVGAAASTVCGSWLGGTGLWEAAAENTTPHGPARGERRSVAPSVLLDARAEDAARIVTREGGAAAGSVRLHPTWHQLLLWSIREGRLELTSGSWVQHDEALTKVSPPSDADGGGAHSSPSPGTAHVALGRTLLLRALAPLLCAVSHAVAEGVVCTNGTVLHHDDLLSAHTPLRVILQSDAFGHTGGTAASLAGLGFRHVVLNRLPFRDKQGRRRVTSSFGRAVLSGVDSHASLGRRMQAYVGGGGGGGRLHALAALSVACGMQGYGPVSRARSSPPPFLHTLHEHYNHPAQHPRLKMLSECTPQLTGPQPDPHLVALLSADLLAAGLEQAHEYCSGYALPPALLLSPGQTTQASGAPGHALIIVGDDFTHDSTATMACLHAQLSRVIIAAKARGRGVGVDVRLSSFHEYLEAAEGQHARWNTAVSTSVEASGASERRVAPWTHALGHIGVGIQDGDPWGGVVSTWGLHPALHALVREAGGSSQPVFPGIHALVPYQDRPFNNAWTGYYGTAPALKLAVTYSAVLHEASVAVADGLVRRMTPAWVAHSTFGLLCSSGGSNATVARGAFAARAVSRALAACAPDGSSDGCTAAVAALVSPTTPPSPSIFTPISSRAARLYTALHHDGLTGTSAPSVVTDFFDGALHAAEQAVRCMSWAVALQGDRPIVPALTLPTAPAGTDSAETRWSDERGNVSGLDDWAQVVNLARVSSAPSTSAWTSHANVLLFTDAGLRGAGPYSLDEQHTTVSFRVVGREEAEDAGRDVRGTLTVRAVLLSDGHLVQVSSPVEDALSMASTGASGRVFATCTLYTAALLARCSADGEDGVSVSPGPPPRIIGVVGQVRVEGRPPTLSPLGATVSAAAEPSPPCAPSLVLKGSVLTLGRSTLHLSLAAMPVSGVVGVGGGTYVLRTPAHALVRVFGNSVAGAVAGAIVWAVLSAAAVAAGTRARDSGLRSSSSSRSRQATVESQPPACDTRAFLEGRMLVWSILLSCALGAVTALLLASTGTAQDALLRGILHADAPSTAAAVTGCAVLLHTYLCRQREVEADGTLAVLRKGVSRVGWQSLTSSSFLLGAVAVLSVWPDALVRPVTLTTAQGDSIACGSDALTAAIFTATFPTSVDPAGGTCSVEVLGRSPGGGTPAPSRGWSYHVSVACNVPTDTELWLRVGGLAEGGRGSGSTASWPEEGGVGGYAALGDVTLGTVGGRLGEALVSTLATVVQGGAVAVAAVVTLCGSVLSASPPPSPPPRLCVHDGWGWVARPGVRLGTDLAFGVWPMPSALTPCWVGVGGEGEGPPAPPPGPAAQRVTFGGWALSLHRPGGVAWVVSPREGWRWPGGVADASPPTPTALLLLHRHTSMDDEKGLRHGAGEWRGGGDDSGRGGGGRAHLVVRARLQET